MSEVKVQMMSTVVISVEKLAEIFAHLDDDQQCKFFVEVARICQQWPDPNGQWYYVGGHLRNCECSTPEAREMIRSIAYYMENSPHGVEVQS